MEKHPQKIKTQVPIGDFQPMVEGMFNGVLPEVGSWLEILWEDGTTSTHQVMSDSQECLLRFIMVLHHGQWLPVFLSCLNNQARQVQMVDGIPARFS